MSNFSTEEEKEQITFDNLQILDLIESGSIIEEAVCTINIYTPQSKIITIKMNQSNVSSTKSKNDKSQKNKENAEEINEMKYNIFLALTKNCIPAYNEFSGVIDDRYLKAKRLIIQDIEIPEYEAIYKPKKFIFIPRKNKPEFETDNGKVVFQTKSEKKNETMKLNGKDLISGKNFNIENIINEKINSCSETKETSTNINYSSDTDGIESNKTIEKNNSANVSEINEFLQNISKSKSSFSSKINNSSEREGDEGFVYYNEIDKYKKYTKYSYVDNFKKEVDGIYISHDEIKLIHGKKELEFENNNNYEYIKNNYNLENGLCANIIIKNFVEESIPKNAPFILEVKAGFELSSILRQIKKASKFIHNMKEYNVALPVYFIGILCSFNKINIEKQFDNLNSKYNGSNTFDIKEGVNSYKHIKRIIEENGIKFVIAIIEDNKIKGYNLGIKDFEVDQTYRKVDIEYMYRKIKNEDTIPKNMLEKINRIRQMFSYVYCSVNLELKIEISYNKILEKDNELAKKDNELEKKDNELAKKDNELEKKEEMIETLKNEIGVLKNFIEEMKKDRQKTMDEMDQLNYQKWQEFMEKNKKESKENKKPEKNEEKKKGEN